MSWSELRDKLETTTVFLAWLSIAVGAVCGIVTGSMGTFLLGFAVAFGWGFLYVGVHALRDLLDAWT